jgi:hypothetical protein
MGSPRKVQTSYRRINNGVANRFPASFTRFPGRCAVTVSEEVGHDDRTTKRHAGRGIFGRRRGFADISASSPHHSRLDGESMQMSIGIALACLIR